VRQSRVGFLVKRGTFISVFGCHGVYSVRARLQRPSLGKFALESTLNGPTI